MTGVLSSFTFFNEDFCARDNPLGKEGKMNYVVKYPFSFGCRFFYISIGSMQR